MRREEKLLKHLRNKPNTYLAKALKSSKALIMPKREAHAKFLLGWAPESFSSL